MKSKKPTRACKCFALVADAIAKAGHADPQFEALGVALSPSTGESRTALTLWYRYAKPAKRAGAKPKPGRSYLLAKFCPLCGVALEGKSL